MKIAIVHDDLMRRGGAEQVALSMLKAFPEADFYTMCYDPESTYPEYKNYKIHTSLFQKIAKNASVMKKLFFPFGIWAMKALKVKGYDVVIISTTFCSKYVKVDQQSIVINYTYTPFRLAWNPTSYDQYNQSRGISRWIFDIVIKYLRYSDAKAAKRANYFVAMTPETSQRIRDAYQVTGEIAIIRPDVKCRNFYLSDKPKTYYLLVSRLEPYKRVDLCIEVFNKLGLNIIIVGTGTKAKELKAMANSNIEFRSGLSSAELADLYANCKAFIFPQHEDYGITPLEANASGRPVIAYEKGGVLSTMIPYVNDASKATAVFFSEQTVQSLSEAITKCEQLEFDPAFVRNHAEKFDESVFIDQLQSFVSKKCKNLSDEVESLAGINITT
ncbi:glycosyl transferase group 1 [Mucilaginibacter sp. PPCGB 2223]|uniref:glycosyltransferase n=1 Tax=Mucilaginibacter sp. PPCGB 2223 TaxID=1886027 RepID=UPI0008270E1A|nr:glycosyltransferase [Mucilaginibacter sp. PPCGB 2223]OCX53922.1 glycosyl transferase group 1 [Mucilaginibacter sp. PPCGB 2223]